MIGKHLTNERGYSTVFFALMILVFLGVFSLCARTLLRLMDSNEQLRQASTASRQILSYYDDQLEHDYGLLAYSATAVKTDKIFQSYQWKDWQVSPLRTMGQLSSFQEQAIAVGKIHLAETGIENLTDSMLTPNTQTGTSNQPARTDTAYGAGAAEERQNTSLSTSEKRRARQMNKKLGQGVSKDWQVKNGGHIEQAAFDKSYKFNQASAVQLTLAEKALMVAYVNAHFNQYVQWQQTPDGAKNGKDRCFQGGEIEYILEGQREASVNQMRINAKLFIIREGVNLAHIVQSRDKMATTSGLATLICALFPLGEPLVQAGLVTLWAGMESAYEVKLLLDGKAIPAVKTAGGTWYTDLESGLTGAAPDSEKGSFNQITYSTFLNMFLMAQADGVTAERAMTLIDLNLKQSGHGIANWEVLVTRHRITVKQKDGKEICIEDGYMESKQGEGQSKR